MDLEEYVRRGRRTIPGWFVETDARIFCEVDAAQRRSGVSGDLLEIGAFFGASATLLGYLRGSGERLVVCDPFEQELETPAEWFQKRRYWTGLTRAGFEANYRRFHPDLPEIVASRSTALHTMKLGRTFRFIHIDGSHEYATVRSDLDLTRRLLLPGGVVALDDVLNVHCPGVTAAVWEAIATGGLVPLAQTAWKLYASWTAAAPFADPPGHSSEEHTVYGHTIRCIEPEESSRRQRLVRRLAGLLSAGRPGFAADGIRRLCRRG